MESITKSHGTIPPNWPDQILIRTVKAEDLPAMEWDGEYAHFRRLYADAFERSRQGRSILWIVELPQAGVIGQVFVQLISDRSDLADGLYRAYIYSFRIRSPYRSRGVGGRLLLHAENDLIYRGFRLTTLNVAKDNPRARVMYERHGYRIVAAEPGIWSYIDHLGAWHRVEEPAWRMEKRLKPTNPE